jgi:U4/U6 small nuclear ribonucleoprotein PRP31
VFLLHSLTHPTVLLRVLHCAMDTFLNDLDELGGSDDEDEDHVEEAEGKVVRSDLLDDLDDSDDDSDDDAMEDLDDVLVKMASTKAFTGTSELRASTRYKDHMSRVTRALNSPPDNNSFSGILEEDPEYKLVVECNTMILDIDEEMISIHRFVVDLYGKKFPELESLIPNKIDYIKTVLRIGNEMDMTLVELNDLLPSASVMVVSVTGSTTSGQPLSTSDLDDCFKACEELLQLDRDKAQILQYVQSRMNKIAPNVCVLIGSRVAAQLMGMAGGLMALSRIPACNIQVMGQERRHMSGFSNISAMPHMGIIQYCDIVQDSPPFIRKKCLKIVAAKVALMARVDSYKNHPDAAEGTRMRKEVQDKIEKLLEPPKAKTKKALPIPEEKKKSRRGGKRVKRWKERFAMTEMRAAQNKMNVSVTEGEYGDSAMGVDMGLLSAKGQSGKIRAPQRKEVKLAKKQKVISASSGQTNGLSSSLVFTPVQGLELVNPNAAADRVKEANKKWFDTSSGFMSAAPK